MSTKHDRLKLLERAYWIATGVNPAQDLGPDAMSLPMTDEEIIALAKLTANIVRESVAITEARENEQANYEYEQTRRD
jgi:hypothetical protein